MVGPDPRIVDIIPCPADAGADLFDKLFFQSLLSISDQ